MTESSQYIQKFKANLWDICASKNIFHAMQESNLPLIKQIFENVIKNYQVQILQDNENKQPLIDHIVEEIRNQVSNIHMTTKEELYQQKKDKFEQDLERKQNEFNLMMKKDIPQEVDFGSIQDEPLGNENLEMMLKEQMKQRENINFNVNESNSPSDSNTNNILDIKEQNIVVQNSPIKVYDPNDTTINNNQSLPQPQTGVHTMTSTPNEMSKLSQNNDKNMIELLQKIINTQEKQNLLLEKLIHSQIHILKQMK